MSKSLTKIVYVTNARLPTEKAHGLATIKLCEAFEKIGLKVEIIAPALWRSKTTDIFDFYKVPKKFSIKKIFTIDLMFFRFTGRLSFLLQIFSFSLLASSYAFLKYRKDFNNIIFFSHDSMPLFFLTFLPIKIFYDIHHFPGRNFLYRRLLKKAVGFAVQTKWKVQALKDKFGVQPKKIVYWPNGVDLREFQTPVSKEEARRKLSLSRSRGVVLYTGQLFKWKGVDTLIRASKLITRDADIYIVGGALKDILKVKEEFPEAQVNKIKFFPFQPHHLMPIWLKAADVLVLPNTAKAKVSLFYTSPMKLFEYLAVGRPIVASAIPSILEIVDESMVLLAEPDSPTSFAQKINYALGHREEVDFLAKKAQREAEKYTWDVRAEKINNYLKPLFN